MKTLHQSAFRFRFSALHHLRARTAFVLPIALTWSRMKLKSLIRALFRYVRRPRPAPAEQLDLGLDEMTGSGLRLRDAMPVRAAEHWLQLGEPDLALRELESLPESARRHPWALRVQLNALKSSHP